MNATIKLSKRQRANLPLFHLSAHHNLEAVRALGVTSPAHGLRDPLCMNYGSVRQISTI